MINLPDQTQSPRLGRIRRPAEERRQETVSAVIDLARESGPEGITTQAIADRMGVTHGALFRHFPDKSAIWHAVFDWLATQLTRVADTATACGSGSSVIGPPDVVSVAVSITLRLLLPSLLIQAIGSAWASMGDTTINVAKTIRCAIEAGMEQVPGMGLQEVQTPLSLSLPGRLRSHKRRFLRGTCACGKDFGSRGHAVTRSVRDIPRLSCLPRTAAGAGGQGAPLAASGGGGVSSAFWRCHAP